MCAGCTTHLSSEMAGIGGCAAAAIRARHGILLCFRGPGFGISRENRTTPERTPCKKVVLTCLREHLH